MRKALLSLVKRFVAGETVEAAVERVVRANSLGVKGLVDFLGENALNEKEADEALRVYLQVLKEVKARKAWADVSLKLTHFGLDLGKTECVRRVAKVCDAARKQGSFVWVDMESSAYTADTLEAYEKLHKEYRNTGVCIQSYLRRSEKDLYLLLKYGRKVRIVKGAYVEQKGVAFQDKREVDEAFERLMKALFEKGDNFAIATHDLRLIEEAKMLSREFKGKTWEFQLLMGVRDSLKPQLAMEGFTVAEYVPFGKNWLPYYTRRLREMRNLSFALKAITSMH